MARRKKPDNETQEQALARRTLESIADNATRSEKVSWDRKIVNLVQQNVRDGVLKKQAANDGTGEWQSRVLDLIHKDNWPAMRKTVCSSVTADDWETVYRFMYENIHESPKYGNKDAWENAIVIIAEHLYKHTLVADPEINAAAMFIRLGQ